MATREWQVLQLAELAESDAKEFRVGDGEWPFRGIVVRWQGLVHVYANSCAHLGYPLNIDPDKFFTADGQSLLCTAHGAVFEPATGLCTGGPCSGASLRRLESRVEDGWVFVSAPDSL